LAYRTWMSTRVEFELNVKRFRYQLNMELEGDSLGKLYLFGGISLHGEENVYIYQLDLIS